MLTFTAACGEVSCWPPLRRWRRMVWACGGGVVLAGVAERVLVDHGGGLLGGSVDDDGLGSGGDVGVGGFGEVSEEDVLPDGGSGGGGYVLAVEGAGFEI